MNKGPCDECGADGEALQCICDPVVSVARTPVKTTRAKSRAVVNPDGDRVTTNRPEPAAATDAKTRHIAPQATHSGAKVICCRCKHVHLHTDRLNEWGQRAGHVMAGRRTECPTGCGYHVTIPYDPVSCPHCGNQKIDCEAKGKPHCHECKAEL